MNLQKAWVPRNDATARRRSAIALIEGLLDMYSAGRISHTHCVEFIKLALWKVTLAEGSSKYQTRFCSVQALTETCSKNVQHEHVNRRHVTAMGLVGPKSEKFKAMLETCVGCTVTKSEHEKLSRVDKTFPDLDGWDRYVKAGVEVVDRHTGKAICLETKEEFIKATGTV